MANVPYNPTQSVTPQVGMPGDYLSSRASGSDFGSQTGQALSNLGQEVAQSGEPFERYAIARQGQLNDAVATDGETKANEAYGQELDILKSKQYTAASAYLPTAIQNITKVRQQIRDSMPNDAARRAFDLRIARQEGFVIREAHSYTDTQSRSFVTKTKQDKFKQDIDQTNRPEIAGNDEAWNHGIASLKLDGIEVMNDLGYDIKVNPETGEGTFPDEQTQDFYNSMIREATGQMWKNRLQIIGTDDPVKALDLLDKHQDEIPSVTLGELKQHYAGIRKTLEINQTSQDIIQKVLDNAYTNTISSVVDNKDKSSFSDISEATRLQEGGKPGETYGITHGKWVESALPGEDEGDDEHRRTVSDRIMQGYIEKYHGDVARARVAYFDGPGNVSESGDIPWKDGGITPGHTITTQEDNRRFFSKLNGSSFGGSVYTNKADWADEHAPEILEDTRQEAARLLPGRPDLQNTVVQRVETNINAMRSARRAQLQSEYNQVWDYIRQRNQSGNRLTNISELANAPGNIPNFWRDTENYYAHPYNNLITQINNETARGKSTDYGTDFWPLMKDVVSGKITDYSQLAAKVDPIKFTGTGAEELKDLLDQQGKPENKPFSQALIKFLEQGHSVAIDHYGDNNPKYTDFVGEENFRHWLQGVLPEVKAKRNLGINIFSPDSSDYVGNSMHTLQRPLDKMIEDRTKNQSAAIMKNRLNSIDSEAVSKTILDIKDKTEGRKAITDAVKKKLLSPEQARNIRDTKGWNLEGAEFQLGQVTH